MAPAINCERSTGGRSHTRGDERSDSLQTVQLARERLLMRSNLPISRSDRRLGTHQPATLRLNIAPTADAILNGAKT